MTRRILGYRCVAPDAPTVPVAPTLARALEEQGKGPYGAWPVRVLELMLEDDAHVEREVPLEEAFGPRAGEVAAFIEEVRQIRWLRPEGAPASARVAALVAEHHAALAEYGDVTPLPVRTLQTWREARDAHETVRAITPATFDAVLVSTTAADTTAAFAAKLVQHAAARLAYCGAWEAAWDAATGALLSEPGLRPSVDTGPVDAMVAALSAAREPARTASWSVALDLFTRGPGPLPSVESTYQQAIAAAQKAHESGWLRASVHANERATGAADRWSCEALHGLVMLTAIVAWRLAVVAAFHASWRAAHIVNGVQRPDPWRPLIDLWRLGAQPAGTSHGSFVVFVPEPHQA